MAIVRPDQNSGGGGGGGSGTVTNVSSSDTSIVVTNPATTPVLKLATLDVIAVNEPPAAAVPLNAQKITGLANGSGAQDAAAFGQLPVLAAADTSVVVAGTAAAPTVRTGTLDVIATQHPPTAAVALNAQKITGLANGSGAQDAAAFGQLPVLAAADTSVVVAGTAAAPTVRTATLDVIAAQHAPAADWSNNAHRITNTGVLRRTATTASSATPTINTDNTDFFSITALAVAVTSFTTNLSGTPTDAQTLWIAITDNGTARALTWGASFESSTVTLPTTTVISTRLDVGFVWNTATSKWRCVAVA